MAERLLLVDDDADLLQLLEDYFSTHGYEVRTARDGNAMRRVLEREVIGLILLDLNLPGENGFDLAREIRASSEVPIIMLTGRTDDMDRIVGLEIGADDYVSKPFNIRELLARVGAVLRRTGGGRPAAPMAGDGRATVAGFEGWRLDLGTGRLIDPAGQQVRLTTGEYRLLKAFVEHPNRVLSRDQLLDFTSGPETDSFDRSIDIQVMRLRRKIEPAPEHPSYIQTSRGIGYIFTPSVEWR